MKTIWGEYLGRPECPFGRRWVLDFGNFAFRLHRWYKLGQQEAMHDHAWWFITFVLSGGYTDVSEKHGFTFRDKLKRFSVRYRPPHHKHYVQVDKGGGLTFVISGKPIQPVWFYGRGKRWKPEEWLALEGPQPCD